MKNNGLKTNENIWLLAIIFSATSQVCKSTLLKPFYGNESLSHEDFKDSFKFQENLDEVWTVRNMLELNTRRISQSYPNINGKHKNIIRMSCDSEYPIETMNLKINFEDGQSEEKRHYFIMKKEFNPLKEREFSYFSPKLCNTYNSNIQMKPKDTNKNKINSYNNNYLKKSGNFLKNKNGNSFINKYILDPKTNSKEYSFSKFERSENDEIRRKDRPLMMHKSIGNPRHLVKSTNCLENDKFINDRNLFDESRRAHNQEGQMSFIQDEEDLSKFHFWGCNNNKGLNSDSGLKNSVKNKGSSNRKQNLFFKAFGKNPTHQTSPVNKLGKNNYLFQNQESTKPSRIVFEGIQEHSNNDLIPKNDYIEPGSYSSAPEVTNYDSEFMKQTDYETGNKLEHDEQNVIPDENKGGIYHNKKNPRGKVIENLKFILSKVSGENSKNVESEDKYRNSPDVKNYDVKNYDYNNEMLTENNDKEVEVEYQNQESPEDYDHKHYDFQQNSGEGQTTEMFSKIKQRIFFNDLPLYHQRIKQKRFSRNRTRKVKEIELDKHNEYDECCNGGVIEDHRSSKKLNKIVTNHKRDTTLENERDLAIQKNVLKNGTQFSFNSEKDFDGQQKKGSIDQDQLLNAKINKDKNVRNSPLLGEIFLPKKYVHICRNIL